MSSLHASCSASLVAVAVSSLVEQVIPITTHTTPRRRWLTTALAATLLSWGAEARADGTQAPSSADEKTAVRLFREGREALERGDLKTACPKFSASLDLVRRSGTLFNLAVCEEKAGHLVRAHALVEEGIRLLPSSDDRLGPSKKQAADLDARIPRLTISLAPDAPKTARVVRDGAPITTLGVEERVDPGRHEVVLWIEGKPDRKTTVDLVERQRHALALTAESAAASSGASSSGASPMRVAGFVLVGLGAATFGVGVATGILTNAKKNEVEDNCQKGCNDVARDAANAGKTLSLVSTVTFVGGLALAAAGTGLVLASPKRQGSTALVAPSFFPGGAGLTIAGRF